MKTKTFRISTEKYPHLLEEDLLRRCCDALLERKPEAKFADYEYDEGYVYISVLFE